MGRGVTGQVNFDSHTSDVVSAAVGAVNVLTPGWSRGKPYVPTTAPDAIAQVMVLADQRRQRVPGDADVAELRAYAERLYAVFGAVEAGDMDAACTAVNRLLADTRAAPVLARHGDDPWHLHFHAPDAGWARSWAASMATAVAMVLGSAWADRFGVCSAAECDRVFVDASRNGGKRFCSTACQNRVKAAAFRARRRDAGM